MGALLKHTFSSPLIKIARARKHLAELEQEIGAFLSTEPARWTHHPSPLHLQIVLPPEHLGAIIGDVVHNLRAALDLVACDMIRVVEGKDANVDQVYFPFCQSADGLEDMIQKSQFHRAGEQAVQVLRGLKPYRGGNADLRAIHDLDVQDKHKSLIFANMTVSSRMVHWLDNDGTHRAAFTSEPPIPPKISMVFPPGSVLSSEDIIPTLHKLGTLTLGVIETFRALANSQ
jgi:hypothetical protein